MKTWRSLAALFLGLAAAILAAAAGPVRPAPAPDLQRLARLYRECRYFDLRDAVARIKDRPSAELEFFRGAVDQVFNRLDPAVSRLRRFIEATRDGPPCGLTQEALALLGDAYRRLGRYGEAGSAFRELRDRFGPVLDPDVRENIAGQAALWSALSAVPPQSVEVAADTAVRMTKRHLPVQVGGRTFFVGTDTGANMSVLYESLAAELGLPVYGPAVRVQTATGGWVEGRAAVIPELRLGSVLVRNAVVLVLDDALFAAAKTRGGIDRRGLLGAPILEGLREFTETKAGELLVPARPSPVSLENMCLSGRMPIVEVRHRRARMSLCLDTGASETLLYPPFYRRYRGEINARSFERDTIVGGIGGSRTVAARVLDEFAFRTGAKDLALRRVLVQVRETHGDSRYFHGALGIDILTQCSRLTLNFVTMSFRLE